MSSPDIPKPWLENPSYKSILLLEDSRNPVMRPLEAAIALDAVSLHDPIYLEMGSNVVRFAWGNSGYELENLTADAAESVQVERGLPVTLGRATTPGLRLDNTASRQHVTLVLLPKTVFGLFITDNDSTNRTRVHTTIEPRTDWTREFSVAQ